MNNEQLRASASLKRALNKCAKAGLSGGVFSSAFCLWPSSNDPQAEVDAGRYFDFFEAIEADGEILNCAMALDGGAGV